MIATDFVSGLSRTSSGYDVIWVIVNRLKTSFSRQKSYANPKRKDVSFSIRELVFLKVSPTKGVMRFGKKVKQTPRYIGPFEIRSRVDGVAFRLVLSPELS